MQRPTTTSPASTPVVYRSLPVVASAETSAPLVPSPTKVPISGTSGNQVKPTNNTTNVPYPPVPISSLLSCCKYQFWQNDDFNVKDFQSKLLSDYKSCIKRCDIKSTTSTLELDCTAEVEDGGNEQCRFSIHIWAVPKGEEGAEGSYLLQVDRTSGCPYYFKQLLKAFSPLPTLQQSAHRPPKLFRAPKLPECMCDEGKGIQPACVERAITLATSEDYEQRRQGVCVLADLCSEDSFACSFKAANGPARIMALQTDSDSYIKRAIARILAECGNPA